jgi:hypothetical protein
MANILYQRRRKPQRCHQLRWPDCLGIRSRIDRTRKGRLFHVAREFWSNAGLARVLWRLA